MKNCSGIICRLGGLLSSLQGFLALMIVSLPGILSAGELDSLRLFYDSETAVTDESLSDESLAGALSDAKNANVVKATPALDHYTVYQYNGFLRYENSYRIYVNGQALEEHTSIQLLSVDDSGRTLNLRTKQGRLFALSIGETKRVRHSLTRESDQ